MDDTLHNGILSVISSYTKQTGLPCVFCPTSNVSPDQQLGVTTSCQLCRLVQTSASGLAACVKQRRVMVEASFREYACQLVTCHANLFEWVAPVFYKGQPVGYFAAGFVFPDDIDFRAREHHHHICAQRFGLDPVSTQLAIDTQMSIAKASIPPLVDLLFSLVRLNIPSGRPDRPPVDLSLPVRANFVMGEAAPPSPLPDGAPLSRYICGENVTKEELSNFWMSVETKTTNVFMNTMSGHFAEARETFEQLMGLVYREKSVDHAHIGAEMLFHIMTLKFYTKDTYDVRFYRLTYDVIHQLSLAQSIREIQDIMDDALRSIYRFFNVNEGQPSLKTVSKPIIDYLEAHYAEDIKLSDIEKVTYMSATYASRLFKKETSLTIKSCLINIRMRHAQELILNSDLMIKDVAGAVGYTDIRGFYKMFAKHFGITCSEMRRSRSPRS